MFLSDLGGDSYVGLQYWLFLPGMVFYFVCVLCRLLGAGLGCGLVLIAISLCAALLFSGASMSSSYSAFHLTVSSFVFSFVLGSTFVARASSKLF